VSSNTMGGKKRRRRERQIYGDEQSVYLLHVSKTFAALHVYTNFPLTSDLVNGIGQALSLCYTIQGPDNAFCFLSKNVKFI
jgi:hypothetical protein